MNTIEKRPTHPLPADALRAAFEDQGLVAPPVPAGLAPGLRELGRGQFASGPVAPLRAAADAAARLAAVASDPSDRLFVGFGGHGVNSNVLHYWLVQAPLVLLLTRRWGNVYDDPQAAARRIDGALAAADGLAGRAARQRAEGRRPAGHWLVVVDEDGGPQQCGWSDLSPASLAALAARGVPDAVPALIAALMDVADDGPRPT